MLLCVRARDLLSYCARKAREEKSWKVAGVWRGRRGETEFARYILFAKRDRVAVFAVHAGCAAARGIVLEPECVLMHGIVGEVDENLEGGEIALSCNHILLLFSALFLEFH